VQINFYDTAFKIDKFLNTPTNESFLQITELFNQKGIEKYFWSSLQKNQQIEKWFTILNDNNLFELTNLKELQVKNFVSYWRPLDFLEKVSIDIKSERIQKNLINIIDKLITEYTKLTKKGLKLHSHIDWLTFKILNNLDAKHLKLSYIDYIQDILLRGDGSLVSADLGEDFFDKIIETKNDKIIRCFFELILTSNPKNDKSTDKVVPLVKDFWLQKLIKEASFRIPKNYQLLILRIALKNMYELIETNKREYSLIWFPSIEKSSQKRYGASVIAKVTLDLARDLLERIDVKDSAPIVQGLTTKEHNIFKRLAIHTINIKYTELKEILWSLEENIIDNRDIHHEVFELFRNHKDDFNDDEVNKIIKWNDSQNFEYLKKHDEYDKYGQKWINNDKRKILYALKDSKKNKIFEVEFNKYNDELETSEDHPEFNSYMSGMTRINDNSPCSVVEISNMNINDLEEKLSSFKESEESFHERTTFRGFGDNLETTINNNYTFYINNLSQFKNINQEFHSYIIDALSKNIINYKETEMILCLDFITSLSELNSINITTLYSITKFIEDISSAELNVEISDKIITKIIELFKTMHSKIEFSISKDENNLDILNSIDGRFYISLILFSLKIARDNTKDSLPENRWKKELKNIIVNDIESKNSINLFEVLGRYLPNLYYLDTAWIKDNIKNLFSDCNNPSSKATFIGYFNNQTVYLDIFNDIKKEDGFIKAVECEFLDSYTNENVIKFIAISFISDNNDTLINKIINNGNKRQLRDLINFFQQKKDEEIDIEKHIKPLWEKLLNRLKEQDFNELNAELLDWITSINTIDDDILKLILKTIGQIDNNTCTYGLFFDELFKFTENNTKEVSEILIAIIEKIVYGFPNQKELFNSVEIIYNNKLIEMGNTICNLVGKTGNYSLKELYIKYN